MGGQGKGRMNCSRWKNRFTIQEYIKQTRMYRQNGRMAEVIHFKLKAAIDLLFCHISLYLTIPNPGGFKCVLK